jgi:iron(III) transport system ATP-binding protein
MSAVLGARPPAEAVAEAPPYLVVEQVSKRFGTFQALERVSLTVAEGEFITFLGPSGCGKTTLLRAIAGLDPATTGRITQSGRDITGLPPAARDFGIVFQSYALFPNLSATENIGYGLRGRAWPKPRRTERVAELLALVGLTEHAAKYPAQLSGGQQQRVALARALANEPGLQRRLGVTTVMVTHDQEEAMGVSDRVVVMSRGRIEQIGTPEAIYRSPASAFVAGFVGRSSHFTATIEAPPGLLLADGLRLPCEAARPMLYGNRVEAFIRPEDVRLGAEAIALPGAFEAQATHLEFLGPVYRLSLEVVSPAAGRPLRLEADVNPDELRALGALAGTTLPVALPAGRLLVFLADE